MVFTLNFLIEIGFIVFGLQKYNNNVQALQCYVCENCVEQTELQVMQICGELTIESTLNPSTQLATTSSPSGGNTRPTTNNASTRRPTTTNKDDDDEYDENYSDYDNGEARNRRIRQTIAKDSMIDENLYEDVMEMKFNYGAPKQLPYVCYMVKYRVNGTQTTSLGCTSMTNENEFLTCQSLNQTGATMEDCRFCYMNGCNKFYLNGNDIDYNEDFDYNNSSLSIARNYNLIYVLSTILTIKWLL